MKVRVRCAAAAYPSLKGVRPRRGVTSGGHPAREHLHAIALFLCRGASFAWTYLTQSQISPLSRKRQRRLRISETVSLGEKRSVAILEVDGQAFLVGSSGSNIALLATLEPQRRSFEQMLESSFSRSEAQ